MKLVNEYIFDKRKTRRAEVHNSFNRTGQVSRRLSASLASVDLNNQNKKNQKMKAVEANTKLLVVPLTDEDFEVLYDCMLEYTFD